MDDMEDVPTGHHTGGPTNVYLEHVNPSIIQNKLSHLPTIEDLLAEEAPFHEATPEEIKDYTPIVLDLISTNPQSSNDIDRTILQLRKKYKRDCGKSNLLAAYQDLRAKSLCPKLAVLDEYLIKKSVRSSSGVLVVTIFTSATPTVDGVTQTFSCKWNCYYCPNEPGQPRSYLLNEPGVRRANRLGFDPVRQFNDRVETLVQIGHIPDKVEILVLGGTWESYPHAYQTNFIRDIFYAANTFGSDPPRSPKSLSEEQLINETAAVRIIGVTLETRPDTINAEMLVRLRQLGCTRVQLGVQHTDDSILMAVNRECTRSDVVHALQLLKDSCFKVDVHLMPDLPGATPEGDKRMFDDLLYSPDVQADQWKIYPCQITPWTVIQKWYEQGKYKPYGFENLVDVIIYAKTRVHPWIRLNRVIRDIPVEYVLGGTCCGNLRQLLENRLAAAGMRCRCMRCREVKTDRIALGKLETAKLVVREYEASGGTEMFLSFESPDSAETLYGFLRLRLSRTAGTFAFPELKGCALIRELHVYGRLVKSTSKGGSSEAQHTGFGKKLLEKAEEISRAHGFDRIAVISGVGVRTYYAKRGYRVVEPKFGAFQIKHLNPTGMSTFRFDAQQWRQFVVSGLFFVLVAIILHALFTDS
eukprot:PhF_6_TR37166/c0_g1_i1/m.54717